MDWIKDLLIQGGLTAIIGLVVSFLTAWVKKGQFENWGIVVGKAVSKLGRKFGGKNYEKAEDVIFISVMSFASGMKKGADLDDDIPIADMDKNKN